MGKQWGGEAGEGPWDRARLGSAAAARAHLQDGVGGQAAAVYGLLRGDSARVADSGCPHRGPLAAWRACCRVRRRPRRSKGEAQWVGLDQRVCRSPRRCSSRALAQSRSELGRGRSPSCCLEGVCRLEPLVVAARPDRSGPRFRRSAGLRVSRSISRRSSSGGGCPGIAERVGARECGTLRVSQAPTTTGCVRRFGCSAACRSGVN